MSYRVLVVDDEFLIRMSLESGLSDNGFQVRTAETIEEAMALIESFHPDAMLLDNRLGKDTGMLHIEEFRKLDEDLMIVLMTAYGSVQNAVEAMKLGASNYVQKPFDLEEIVLILKRGMEQRARKRSLEIMRLKPRRLFGVSPAIQEIREKITLLAQGENQLQRHSGEPDRVRALRLRKGRLHRRAEIQEGALRAGGRGHRLPGRGGGAPRSHAGKASHLP